MSVSTPQPQQPGPKRANKPMLTIQTDLPLSPPPFVRGYCLHWPPSPDSRISSDCQELMCEEVFESLWEEIIAEGELMEAK